MTAVLPHPLSALTVGETNLARDIVLECHQGASLKFRAIWLLEPPKTEVIKFLELEHSAQLSEQTQRPPRLAQLRYDAIYDKKAVEYHESVVDLREKTRVGHEIIDIKYQAGLIVSEFDDLLEACKTSSLFQKKLAELELPQGFEVVIEPWPYGAADVEDGTTRFFQGLIFAQDTRSGNPDSNFYAYPLPLIPIMDARTKEIVRVEELATGGVGDALRGKSHLATAIHHCKTSEYVPELLPGGTRTDLKPLTVIQPEGPSFSITQGNLVQWQKWSMRFTFNPREGLVLHDICYDGRSILYRLSLSEMTVPYADPRPPFHRKQAFDFGDGAFGDVVNNLTLGCDCLGVIKYFDGVITDSQGQAQQKKNVICLHEQDDGVSWKHLNWRTGRSVVARRRLLIFQFSVTLANYDYIFAFKFDQAAGISVEARATGIVSVVNIDPGKRSNWGNVVSPGALAQNHQHVFCVRIDPAIDGHVNRVVQEESLPVQMDQRTNPQGNLYQVHKMPIVTSAGLDAAPMSNRLFKIQNASKLNPVTGNPVAYKIVPPATQLLIADPKSTQRRRAQFASHHFWVTKYKDDEFYAGGRYPLQSRIEVGGLGDAADRNDDVLDTDLVVWSVFGLTHNPRSEDWPVMPIEKLELNILPADFFTENPALDVPSTRDTVGSPYSESSASKEASAKAVDALTHVNTEVEEGSLVATPRKNFNTLSTLSLATSLMATWEAMCSTLGASLVAGGPVSLLYGFILAVIGNLATAASLSEPASMYPGAGGQYQFISELSSPRYRGILSFFSGWITLLGWVALTASAPYAAGNLIQGVITLEHPDIQLERYRTTLLYIAILVLSFCFNQWGSRILPLLENLIMTLHILFWFMMLIAIAVIPPHRNSAAFVFTEFDNNSGWENDGVAWCLGMLTSAYVLIGYDSATHLSEELQNPRVAVPHAMIGCIVINGAMGFGILIAVLFGMGSVQDALAANTGFPIISIFYYMTRGNAAAAAAMTCTIIISASLATVGLMAATSRTLWAFARDRGPPFAHWLSELNVKSRVPTNALMCVTVALALLGLLNIASTAAFGAILSLTVVALNLSYLFPVVAMLYRRVCTPDVLTWGPWRMSPALGIAVNILSICWILFVTAFLLLPATKPITALNMNYASAVLGGVLIFAALDWVFRGSRQYAGAMKGE